MADHDKDALDYSDVAEKLAALAAERLGYEPARVRVEIFVEPADDGVHVWMYMQFYIDDDGEPSDHERQIVSKLLKDLGVPGVLPVVGRA